MKVVVLAAFFVGVLLLIAFIAHVASEYVKHRRRLRIEHPMLAGMTRKDRREYSRELRQREREQYELRRQQDLEDVINGRFPPRDRA
ncbi:hypothetical protein [Mycolicibacterium phlei]|uniref:hypothetical protein n=1 Tax=Mycolicibacterium phlei TaxID=1771 RepID=UPI0002D9A6AF|nr:hypothetical protein [Mycolicibacterium phlei]